MIHVLSVFSRLVAAALFVSLSVLLPSIASAQQPSVATTDRSTLIPPEVITRDAQGHVTVRATRLTEPLKVDGHLDERAYEDVPSMTDFIQNDPSPGTPATQKTEVWVF